VVFSETVPSAESILNEAIELVAPSAKAGDEYTLREIAIRQAKVRSCEKAKDLFKTAADSNERWAKEQTGKLWIENHIGFLRRLVAAQRRAGCVEEMKYAAQRLIALYQQQNQKHLAESAGNELTTARHNLQLQLNLGELYLSIGNLDAARGVVPKIIQQVRAAKWRPSLEFEAAATFLARMGHDDDALEVVNRYDQFFEARQEIKEDPSNTHYWIYRVGNLAAVAEAQAEAGHTEAARATLRRAIEKARSTPVARLTEVYGEQEIPASGKPGLHSIGEGEALQSAGAMKIVWHAARIGETVLALEAFNLVSPLAMSEIASAGALITALAKKGEVAAAQKLLDRFRCSSRAIALGLLEKQEWAGAIQADEAYQKSSCCERECNFFEHDTDYWADLGKARTFVRGPTDALTWARNQTKDYRVYALLGVVDALVEQDQLAAPPATQRH
jgi:tetratricopeptide (TPR) repeat protein